MAGPRTRFRYRRERADNKENDTTDRKAFERWLREAEPGDRFFVADCRWVQCEQDGTVISGGDEIPHVRWVTEADAVEN